MREAFRPKKKKRKYTNKNSNKGKCYNSFVNALRRGTANCRSLSFKICFVNCSFRWRMKGKKKKKGDEKEQRHSLVELVSCRRQLALTRETMTRQAFLNHSSTVSCLVVRKGLESPKVFFRLDSTCVAFNRCSR